MDKFRTVNTKFWDDNWIIDLDPVEKLLFIYLLTNHTTNLAGIYELHIRKMAFDTGIEKDMVSKILQRFEKDKKVIYKNGWILICNFTKNQRYNPKMLKNVEKILGELPDWIKNDSVYIPYIKDIYTHCINNEIMKEGKNEIMKEGNNIPSFDEFKKFALKNDGNIHIKDLELKYNAWKSANWNDGHGNAITNWQSKLLHTIPHIKKRKAVPGTEILDDNKQYGGLK